jgi:transposase
MTKKEFERNMNLLHAEVAPKLRAAMQDDAVKPLYVWDNVGLQDKAAYPRLGFARTNRVTIPPHSPDFNKPIEHVWNQIKRKLLARIYKESEVQLTPQMAQEWVAEAFTSTTKESIQADIKTLPDTWQIIKSPTNVTVTTSKNEKVQGSYGDYPPSSSYR